MAENDRNIAFYIYAAQCCSDGGKKIHGIECLCKTGKHHWERGYRGKVAQIRKAINLIVETKKSAFKYFIIPGKDEDKDVVRFQVKIKGEKVQVSFHVRRQNWTEKELSKNMKIPWIKGSSSRVSLVKIIRCFKLR